MSLFIGLTVGLFQAAALPSSLNEVIILFYLWTGDMKSGEGVLYSCSPLSPFVCDCISPSPRQKQGFKSIL